MARKTASSADGVSKFAPLTGDDVKAQTDEGSFTRGRAYEREGRIHDTVLRDATIEALCDGSEITPYHVWATLARPDQSGANPRDYSCTCPRGGFCKHIVALLLTWIHEPERFVPRASLADHLGGKSREDLVVLIEQMINRYPDLESLVESPLPVTSADGEGPANVTDIDETTIRRQVKRAIRNIGPFEWGVDPGITRNLNPLLHLGQQYAEAGQWANARVVFTVLAQEACEWMRSFRDDESEMSGIIIDCDEGLAACLEAQAELPESGRLSAEARKRLIEAIYDIWHFDIFELGGIDISREGPEAIARHATAGERAIIESWLWDEHIEKTDSWKHRARIGFITLLREESGLDDEELLKLYQEAELWSEVADLLLGMGHADKAMTVARQHLTSANAFLWFANLVIAQGGDNIKRAITLVEDRLWETEGADTMSDSAIQGWLVAQLGQHNRPADALAMAERHFRLESTFRTWQEARDIARLPGQKPGTWDELRPRLERTLKDQKSWGLLVDIYLSEDDVRAALDAFAKRNERKPSGSWSALSWGAPGQDSRLAQADEADFPDEAVAIYHQLAEKMIRNRQRSSYKVAAEHLFRAKSTLERHDRAEEWLSVIEDVRTEHKTLRALREELDALGL